MARLFAHNLKLLMLAVIAFTVTASAQTTRLMKVNVPFEFSFGQQSFPAGQYTLVQPEQNLLMLRNSDGRTIAITFTENVESKAPAEQSMLRFNLSDGRYRLAEVWQQANSSGDRMFPAKSQVNMAKRRTVDNQTTATGGGQP